MPGPFTHIYTARRVAEFLASENVTKEFLRHEDDPLLQGQALDPKLLANLDPKTCADAMNAWQKFTATGALGPDMFFWLQDYNVPEIKCDEIMLAMSLLYYLDDQGVLADPFDGLLTILSEAVPDSWGKILKFIIELHKLYIKFMKFWQTAVGEMIYKAGQLLDDLAGGLLTSLAQALDAFKNDIIALIAQELVTHADIFGWFSLKMRGGFDEQAFVWSDMTHYRRTSVVPARFIKKAQSMMGNSEDLVEQEHGQQLLAFALGWVCHVGTDVIAHSFVNEQCGGPFRTHWQRHHLIENHIDAYNYECTRNGTLPADDFCGWKATYESLADSALYFAVQIPQDIDDPPPTNGPPRNKLGDLRQTLPDDSDGDVIAEEQRKKLLDTDGTLPLWLAEIISKTFIEVYADPTEGGDPDIQDEMISDDIPTPKHVPHPMNLKGQNFQNQVNNSTALIAKWLALLDINHIPDDLEKVREIIAPDAATGEFGFQTPVGFPFPWEIQVAYRFMLSWFKRSFLSTFNMPCPQPPEIFTPPASDIPFSGPPDTSGVNPDDDPISQACELIAAVLDWFVKQIEKVAQFIWDLIKTIASAGTWPLREDIYRFVTLPVWSAGEAIRMVLCHLGYFMPQSYQNWPGTNNMKYPNEIDEMLIRLGHSVNSAFEQALAAAGDPFGNLDKDPSLNLDGVRDVQREPHPWLPVRAAPGSSLPAIIDLHNDNILEFLRPWAYPDKNNESNPEANGNFIEGPKTIPGPYARDTMPHQMLTDDRLISNQARTLYENAGCPGDTQLYSKAFILHEGSGLFGERGYDGTNPLGDPIPFSAYLIGQIAGNANYISSNRNFNLDADRGYGYLCWDWQRELTVSLDNVDGRGNHFSSPKTWPEGAFPEHDPNKWIADPAKGVGTFDNPNMHMKKNVDEVPATIEADMLVSYFGRKKCVEKEGGVDQPPDIPEPPK